MGEKGARQTQRSEEAAESLISDLAPLGEVTAKKMFGGHGIFCDGVMFGLIDSNGTVHLRADDSTEARFEGTDSTKHARMPYWSVPPAVLESEDAILSWASESLDVARAAKR